MYHVASYFDVTIERREDFIEAALADGRDSIAAEPETIRFEVIQDEKTPTRFYLNEAYADHQAFDFHVAGPHFRNFFSRISGYLQSTGELIKGDTITQEETTRLLLRRWTERRKEAGDPQKIEGNAELYGLLEAQQLGGIRITHVTFENRASTKWHVHDGEQVLFVLTGRGFVESEGGSRMRIEKGDIVRTPAGERHRHGAEGASMTHLAITTGLKTCWPHEECWEESRRGAD